MKKQQQDFEIVPYSKLRRGMALTLRSAQRTPMIYGLIEVDVTKARAHLRHTKQKPGSRSHSRRSSSLV